MFPTTAITGQAKSKRLAEMLRYLNAAKRGEAVPGMSSRALDRLAAYFDSWMECAPNAMAWRGRFPEHWQAIGEALDSTKLALYAAVDGVIPAWDTRPGVTVSKNADLWRADKLFADFLAFFNDSISICKREACGSYFERTAQRTTYCSERCANTATSLVAKRAARHIKRHAKLARVLSRLQRLRKGNPDEWTGGEYDEFWKNDLQRHVKGVTVRWLNEAVLQRHSSSSEQFASCPECRSLRERIMTVIETKEEER
jgi:hypothetical protein